jgi:hypothetical protein
LALLKSDTLPPPEAAKDACVIFNWKNRTVTPLGGVSVTVRLTGTLAGLELPSGAVVTEDWLPHPDTNRKIPAMVRKGAVPRIVAS